MAVNPRSANHLEAPLGQQIEGQALLLTVGRQLPHQRVVGRDRARVAEDQEGSLIKVDMEEGLAGSRR